MVRGLHVSNFATRGTWWQSNRVISDFIDRAGWPQPAIVIKSVSAHGRARLFLEALPGSRIVFIIRHPCAQVASMLRGFALGKFGDQSLLQDLRRHLHVWQLARRHREVGFGHLFGELLAMERSGALPKVEELARWWAMLNQKTIEDLTGLCGVSIVRYEDLVADPAGVVRELFAFTGLTWDPQTAAFMLKSTTSNGRDRYYGIKKKSSEMIVKWRKQLSLDDQCRILEIARSVPIGRLFGKVDQNDAAILPGWVLKGALYTKSPAGGRCVP
jgi:hypothetical protein